MNRIIRGINIAYVILLLIVLMFVNLQFKDAGEILNDEVKQNAKLSVEIMNLNIKQWIEANEAVILKAKGFIENNLDSDDEIYQRLQDEMSSTPIFKSLYYGKNDNTMIIASDIVLPPSFDLRQRPWYLEAIKADALVITAPFLDAPEDEWIVTVAMPIKDTNGDLLGVVGGDIPLNKLKAALENTGYTGESVTFLMSSTFEKMIEINHMPSFEQAFSVMSTWYDVHNDNQSAYGMTEKAVGKLNGYFHYHEIPNTGWVLLSFTPSLSYSDGLQRLWLYSLGLSISIVVIFVILMFIVRRYITKPLIEFEEQVELIDVDKRFNQRIRLSSYQALGKLSEKINNMLSRIFEQVQEIHDDRDELMALNEELEATYGQLVATEQEVTRQKQNFEALFRNAQDAVVMFDQEHRVLDINESFEQLFGYTLEEIQGINLDYVVSNGETRQAAEALTTQIFKGDLVRVEGIRCGKNNIIREVSIQGVPMTSHGVMIGGYGIYSDISERREREKHLAYISTHDDLTGLYTRGYFEEQMSRLKETSNLPLGILMLDVNGLKLINDAFGHKAGDYLLKEIAEQIKLATEDKDVIARMGGDEFSILITNCSVDYIEALSGNIVSRCNKIRVDEVAISISSGYAIIQDLEDSFATAMKTAEDYLNKRKLTEGPSVRGKAIYTIVNTLHEKNRREEQHSTRVSELGYGFGKALNLSDREINELKTIGLLHDVGKIGIEEKILNKDGKLSSEEYCEMQKHPAIGYRILSTVNEMGEIAEYVLAHHESFDGTGYPKKLKGHQIPYLSRIVTIIDAFDAMTSDRTYRKAMTNEEAFEELRRVSGVQFDPEIVEPFIQFVKSGMYV